MSVADVVNAGLALYMGAKTRAGFDCKGAAEVICSIILGSFPASK